VTNFEIRDSTRDVPYRNGGFVIDHGRPAWKEVVVAALIVSASSLLGAACVVAQPTAAPRWITSEVRYVHHGVGAGPVMITRSDGSPEEERRFEPFGAALDAYRTQPGRDDEVGPVDFVGFDLNSLNKRTEPASGWSYHGARWHAPSAGRWLSPDPPVKTPDGGFLTDPWALHPYAYVQQNPTQFWDPEGESPKTISDQVANVMGQIERDYARVGYQASQVDHLNHELIELIERRPRNAYEASVHDHTRRMTMLRLNSAERKLGQMTRQAAERAAAGAASLQGGLISEAEYEGLTGAANRGLKAGRSQHRKSVPSRWTMRLYEPPSTRLVTAPRFERADFQILPRETRMVVARVRGPGLLARIFGRRGGGGASAVVNALPAILHGVEGVVREHSDENYIELPPGVENTVTGADSTFGSYIKQSDLEPWPGWQIIGKGPRAVLQSPDGVSYQFWDGKI
jgi:RHS repeat-associated protein